MKLTKKQQEIEERTLAKLKQLVDQTANQLRWGNLIPKEAIRLVETTRKQAEQLIPDMMEKYDLIYGSRFRRLIWQFVLPREAGIAGRVPLHWAKGGYSE